MLTNITSNTHPKTASLLEHAAPQATQYLAELDSRAVAPSADAVAQLASFKHPLQGGPVNPKQVIRELDEIGSSTAHRAHNHLYAGRKHQYRNHGPDRQYLRGRTARRHVGTCGQCVMPVDGGVANLIERTCGYARRFASAMQSAGYDVLNDVVLNQVLVSFGAPEVTLQVVRDIQADGTCWCGSTVWQERPRCASALYRGRRLRKMSIAASTQFFASLLDIERQAKVRPATSQVIDPPP